MHATAPLSAPHPDARVQAVIDFFAHLRPSDLDRLDALYSAQAQFKDPFNEVQGVPAIRAIFEHMFETTVRPRFTVHEAVAEGDACFLVWTFHFGVPRWVAGEVSVRGGSHLRFDDQGRVALHRDYWDAAEELYEKLPVLGRFMRWLRQRNQPLRRK